MKTKMSVRYIFWAVIFLISSSVFGEGNGYSGGTGEPNDPYQISDVLQLKYLSENFSDWDKCFVLTRDIEIPPGLTLNPIGEAHNKFTGSFDGKGHVIKGLINKYLEFPFHPMTSYRISRTGLFGHTGPTAKISNLGLTCANIDYIYDLFTAGLLVGQNEGTITNCYSTGAISGLGEYASILGGLVGFNKGTINNCYSSAFVSITKGGSGIGGLVGFNYRGTITNCYSTGFISVLGESENSWSERIGGLVGRNSGSIRNCCSCATVSVLTQGGLYLGGLAGSNKGTIEDCYSSGTISGSAEPEDSIMLYFGGLVGENTGAISTSYSSGAISCSAEYVYLLGGLVGFNDGKLTNCYSHNPISGTGDNVWYLGGLVGQNENTISNCYSSGAVSAVGESVDYIGGLVGENLNGLVENSFWDIQKSWQSSSAGGTGLDTNLMKTVRPFYYAGWDFNEIWRIENELSYPYLNIRAGLEQQISGDIDLDRDVDFYDFAMLADNWLVGTE